MLVLMVILRSLSYSLDMGPMLAPWICGSFRHYTKRPQNRGQKFALFFSVMELIQWP